MLDAIDTDLKRKRRTPYVLARMGYDTPFFNGDSISQWDDVDECNVCVNDKCSPQIAVNRDKILAAEDDL